MKKINIDECYIALISRYEGYKKQPNNMVLLNFSNVKFTIVKYVGFGTYKDIITDEEYDKDISEYSEKGVLCVKSNYFILPLSSLVNSNDNFISKKKLLEAVREPLIELTSLLYTEERGKLNKFETIQKTFSKVHFKQKRLNNLNKRRSKR